QRGDRDFQGRSAVQQRGAGHRQRGAPEPQRRARPEKQRLRQPAWQRPASHRHARAGSRIRRFTPMAEKLLNLIATDVGRPISDIQLGLAVPDLESALVEVMEAVTVREIEVRDKQGRWNILRLRPYRTQENRIDGAVLVLIDVDSIKSDQETLRRQTALLNQVSEAIFMWDPEGGIVYWNRGAQETYGFNSEQALGRA